MALALALTGCSSGADNPEDSPSTASPSTSASAETSSSEPTESATEEPSAPSTGAPGDALASKGFTVTGTYSQTDVSMRLDIMELKRRGDLLQLTANLVNTETDRSKDLRWQIAQRFESALPRDDLHSINGSFSGVLLTDVANKQRYLVAADSAGDCVCTTNLSATFVGAGQTIELTATFAAPPESTTQLDVDVASLGLFRDLPVI